MDYGTLTQNEFDTILTNDVLADTKANELISIPGIYEILAEEFNNEVCEIWLEKRSE